MKLTIGTLLGSSNTRINVRNLPTHFLLTMYARRVRPVWAAGGWVERPLTKAQHRELHNLLRLRSVKRGGLNAEL